MDISLLGFGGLTQINNLHPVFVHFPVAILPVSSLFYAIGLARSSTLAFFAGRACLGLAAAGAAVAVYTGLRAEHAIVHNDAIHRIMEMHEILGFGVLGSSLGLLGWSAVKRDHRPPVPGLFVAILGCAALLVLQTADLGGRMVFVEGAGVRAAESIVSAGHAHGTTGPDVLSAPTADSPPAGHGVESKDQSHSIKRHTHDHGSHTH